MRLAVKETEAENLFATLANKSPVGICIIQDGRFCYTNPTFQSNTGYSEDELLGRDSLELIVPEDREIARENAIKMLKGESTLPHQFRVIQNDGSIHWVIESVAPVQYRGRPAVLGNILDITEHKQVDEALQAEKNKLQSLIDTIEDHITIRDRDYNLIYMAEHAKKLWGDRTGEKCYRVLEGQDKVCDGCPAEKAFRDGKPHTSERKTVTPSGEVLLWETRANPIRDAEGRIVACLEIARNITERKQMVETLQAERNKLQSLIDSMEDGLTIQDRDYNIIYQNEPSRIAYGGDHLGEKCYRIYASRDKVCPRCPVAMAFRDGKSHTVERRKVMPSGKVTFWENTANPIRDAEGKIVSCLELTRDVTERKKMEERLKLLSSVTEQVSDATIITAADFNIAYVNKAAQDLFGYSPEEMLGKHIGAFNAEPLPKSREQKLEQTLSSGKPWTGTLVKKRKDGSTLLCECHITPLHDDEGKISSYIDVIQDVTERKRAEEMLQAESNKLQSIIDAMSDTLTIQDTEYNIIFQNELSQKSTGGDRTGRKCYRVYEGREKICEGCPVEKAFKDGKSHTAERQRVLPSGELSFWENTANPVRDAGGRVVACLEIGRNITERKKQEQALADEATRRRLLVDQSLDGIVVLDEDAKVCEANQRFAEMLGYTHKEVLKLHTWDWDKNFPPEQILEMGRNVDEKGLHLETKHTRKDGSVFDVDISINGTMCGGQKLIFCVCRDITERKQAKETLQAEKNKLQSLIDAMEDGLTIQDRDYKIIYQNESLKQILGDHLGEKCYRAYAHKAKVCDVCPLAMAFRDGKSHSVEKEVKLPSGKVAFWEPTANPVRDAKGKIVSCLEIIRDITERKRQEQALADELTRRRLLVDQSLDGIVVIDENDKVYEANQRFAEMLGYTPEEVRELHTWDWEKNYSREQIHEQGSKADEKGFLLETTHTRKDGSVIDVDISINASMFGGQKLIFCVCRDVTERKKAEQALADELAQRRLLIDKSLDGIVVLDEDARVVEANQRFAEMLGYTLEEVRELHTWDWDKNFPPEKILKIGRTVDEKGLHLQTKHTRKDGSVIDVDISISGIMYRGRKLIFCIQRDITERNRAEEALKNSEESYRELADSITEVFFAMDEHLRYTYWNKASEILTGVRVEDALGKSLSEVFPDSPGTRRAEKVYRAVLKTQKSKTFVNDFDIDGRHYIFEISAYPSRGGISVFVRDITERKRAEEALRQSEENYRALFDSAVIGTIVIDAETMKLMVVNQAAAEMLGFSSAEELVGVSALTNIPPEDRESVSKLMAKELFEQDLRQTREFRMTTQDGRVIWISANAARITHEGRLAGLASFTDITERKQMEEAINLQKAYFQQLFDNSPDAILMMDTNDRAIQANRGFEVLFGYSNEEVKGRSLIELIVPEVDVQEASDSFQRILGGEVIRKESVRRRKDGSLVDVSVLAYPIRSNGNLIGAYGVYSDITERKRAEEAIKRAAEEWRETFDSITDAISIHDRDYKILRANKAFADIFHKKPSQILGRYCYELHKGEKPISGCPHKQTLATKQPALAEFYESNLGKYLLESTSPIFDEKGKVVGTVHITRDVTEQKQQNERLMMADRLASIGELAAGTAHELNNPLTSVIGFSQLLMEKNIPDDIREDVEFIYNEAQRAANVTKNLLTFGRKHAPVKQLNQINKIIEDVLNLRAYEHKVNGIEVKKQLAPDLPEIMVDYFQMQQVFLNIIINAEYFMIVAHNRGTLTITTKKQNSTVKISIADDGPGISREDLSRIFNPFFTTKEAGKGTGLGLSICHGIVSEHGGQIYARTQQGKGATIVIELPINSR